MWQNQAASRKFGADGIVIQSYNANASLVSGSMKRVAVVASVPVSYHMILPLRGKSTASKKQLDSNCIAEPG